MTLTIDDFVRPTSCSDCPFTESAEGRNMRESLAAGRFDSILAALREEKSFDCHQTRESNMGRRPKSARICAGALAYQRKNGCVPTAVQVAERLIAIQEGRKARW